MGRGEPCAPIGGSGFGLPVPIVEPGIGIEDLPPTAGSALLANPITKDDRPGRAVPKYDVLGFISGDGFVNQIYVEETIGFDLPIAKIKINNLQKQLSSLSLAKEQSSFRVSFGYDNPGIKSHGTYIVQRPKFKFMGGTADSDLHVEIIGYGEQVKLAATERREVYKKQRDSDIVRKIAARYGFSADVGPTNLVHDQVIQANESDYKFLARRAKLYGFMLYVNDGVLHFHEPRPKESGIKFTYLEKGQGNLSNFSIQSRTFLRGLSLKMTQIDPLTKEEFDVNSAEDPDTLQRTLDFQNWKELVSIPGVGQPQRFITNEGHEQQRSLFKDQITKMAQASRYVISGEGTSIGMESLRVNDLITIDGIGRSSGKYYVTRAIHHLDSKETGIGGGFRTRFEVVRAGAGALVKFIGGSPNTLQRESVVRL
jgi:phage protein D